MSSTSSSLMPSERICLKKTRNQLVRQMDVTTILPQLVGQSLFSSDEEAMIMADSRRRERVSTFIDVLEKKNSKTFQTFVSLLSSHDPQLYLVICEWDKNDNLFEENPTATTSGASINDQWSSINRSRDYLLTQIDGADVMSRLDAKWLKPEQRRMILDETVAERRTQALLDLLETKRDSDIFTAFMDVISELYPHVYLELTDSGGADDDW